MSGALVLGVDGGGSKTLVALADEAGNVVRISRGEGINPLASRGWPEVLEAMLRASASPDIAGVAAGLPAHGEIDAVSAQQRQVVTTVFGATPQLVLNDVDAAHLGAFAGGPGILVLSGTGSMAWARDAAGRSYRVGGWGDVIGDEGSSYWIGRRILGHVSQSLDGRLPPTGLAEALFQQLGVDAANPANGLEGWIAHLAEPRAGIAALAPLATRLAESGDAGGQAIIDAAADELARHAVAIAKHAGPADWSYAGGSFASRALREAVAARIGRQPVPPRLSPIGGALLAAARLADWPTSAAWTERLAASLQTASIADQRQSST